MIYKEEKVKQRFAYVHTLPKPIRIPTEIRNNFLYFAPQSQIFMTYMPSRVSSVYWVPSKVFPSGSSPSAQQSAIESLEPSLEFQNSRKILNQNKITHFSTFDILQRLVPRLFEIPASAANPDSRNLYTENQNKTFDFFLKDFLNWIRFGLSVFSL